MDDTYIVKFINSEKMGRLIPGGLHFLRTFKIVIFF